MIQYPEQKTPARLVLMLLTVFATLTAWADSSFGGGDGTGETPYIISTTAHMRQLATDVNNGNSYHGKHFQMTANLDFDGEEYIPIGKYVGSSSPTGYYAFEGFFNGDFHEITNVTINKSNTVGVGLFGVAAVYGLIRNLTLSNSSITGKSDVGGIVGDLMGGTTHTDRGVRNCAVTHDVTITGQKNVGGITGWTEGDIAGSQFYGTVSGTERIGGIAGGALSKEYIQGCYVGGNCTLGAVGEDGSATGTDEGVDVTHLCTLEITGGASGYVKQFPKHEYRGVYYYECNATVPIHLEYTGEAEEGCTAGFAVSGGTLAPAIVDYTLTLPYENHVTVSASSVNTLLDIAYETVTVSIPDQEYTGSALTPVVTVTDGRSGSVETLQENTDYSVLMPSEDCIYAKEYTIGIVGMGRYGGKRTATFTVYHPTFDNGSGSPDDPFIIDSTDEMDKLAASVQMGRDMSGLHFRQTANLDYQGKTYTPVGSGSTPFNGTYDGYFYTIKNVNNVKGIFGDLNYGATVRNVVLSSSSLSGYMYVGGIAAYSKGLIESCRVYADVTVSGNREVGGIVGRTDNGTVSNCHSEAAVTGSNCNTGGIVGLVNEATITGCMNEGNVSCGNNSVGGIAGAIYSSNIEYCINTGTVTGTRFVGGIAGMVSSNNNSLNNCLNLGSVSASETFVGGIIGDFGSYNTATLHSNHYAGNCTTGGVAGSDMDGAKRGWIVSADEGIYFDLMPDDDDKITGTTFDGVTYVGAGEATRIIASRGAEFSDYNFKVNAGSIKAVTGEEELYTLTMPTEGQDVTISLLNYPTLNLLDDDSNDYQDNAMRISNNDGVLCHVRLVGRTLYRDGEWNTLTLPFDFSNKVLSNYNFFNGATILEMDTEKKNGLDTENGTLYLSFKEAAEIQAGKPYLIKWDSGDDIVEPLFKHVEISNTEPIEVTSTTSGLEEVKMKGNYGIENVEANDQSILFLSGNTLYYSKTDRKLRTFRAHFELTGGQNAPTGFDIDFGDKEPTGVQRFSATENADGEGWYQLDGRRIQGKPAKKGIYVKEGKKVIAL